MKSLWSFPHCFYFLFYLCFRFHRLSYWKSSLIPNCASYLHKQTSKVAKSTQKKTTTIYFTFSFRKTSIIMQLFCPILRHIVDTLDPFDMVLPKGNYHIYLFVPRQRLQNFSFQNSNEIVAILRYMHRIVSFLFEMTMTTVIKSTSSNQ